MIVGRCLRILVLVSLVPLALRASSLLGHVAAPPSLSTEPEPGRQPRRSTGGFTVGVTASTDRRRRRTMEGALSALNARRFRQHGGGGGGGGGFEADKRLAPTGSNPLHNLR